jgi:transposase
MSGRSRVQATEAERQVLRQLARSSRRGEADRARAILHTLEGQRAEDIARSLGANVSTVREWRGLYLRGGVAALRYRPPSGGRPGTVGQQALAVAKEVLAEDAAHDRHWTLPRLCAEIERRGGVRLSEGWLSVLLRKRATGGAGRATPWSAGRRPRPSSVAASA